MINSNFKFYIVNIQGLFYRNDGIDEIKDIKNVNEKKT